MKSIYLPLAAAQTRGGSAPLPYSNSSESPVRKLGKLTILLGLLALSACTPSGADALDEPAPRQSAPTDAAHRDKLQPPNPELVLSAEITADGNRTARVFPLVGGRVLRVGIELGDEVRRGQVLAVLQSGEIASLQNESTAGTADLAVARKNLAVAEELFEAGLNAQNDVYRAQKEVERAVGTATKNLKHLGVYGVAAGETYVLRAPLAGFVTEKNLTTGLRFTTANLQSAFTVANLDSVWVLANVFEADLTRVQLGQPVEITTLSYPDQPLKGRIDRVFNQLDRESKVLKVRCKLPNPGHLLKPGMRAQMRVLNSPIALNN